MRRTVIDFSRKLRDWDGFGVTYVQAAQTADYQTDPQDYGGFSNLSEAARQQVLDLIFGDDGLRPGLTKMFLDPFHQPEGGPYDHQSTTGWMRYFVREGLTRSRSRDGDLAVITTLYGPPGWMTKQRLVRGRDLNPAYRVDCARYMIDWARYLREVEGLPVRYISLHNEGEAYFRWPADGAASNLGSHDYNLLWSPKEVCECLRLMRPMLDAQGMQDVGLTPGETTYWHRFAEWGYAQALAADEQALQNLGLITSHGFVTPNRDPTRICFAGDFASVGNDLLREKRPDLHSWVTSFSWAKMDVWFINDIRNHIYYSKVNGMIPWAAVQWEGKWKGGDPNSGTAIRVQDDGSFSVLPGYYWYKQVCRAGQPGMGVAAVTCNDSEVSLIGFTSNGTAHTDAWVAINLSEAEKGLDVELRGSASTQFEAYRTSDRERFSFAGTVASPNGTFACTLPPLSVTTFFGR